MHRLSVLVGCDPVAVHNGCFVSDFLREHNDPSSRV